MTIATASIGVFIIGLIWFAMSARIGSRTILRQAVIPASPERVWQMLYPFGEEYNWNNAAPVVKREGDHAGVIVTSHASRDGSPIERSFVLDDVEVPVGYRLRYTSDTSLHQSFWASYSLNVQLEEAGSTKTRVIIRETDTYRGAAFAIFRYFALRRMMLKLDRYARTGKFVPGGIFEHPLTQFAFAGLSMLLLWPIFGMNKFGFFLAATLTAVVAMHELGHMAAFRLMGHKTARMIFIPLLGGIALGGRPYDRHFEVGFSALMGAGFSTFVVIIAMAAHDAFADTLSPLDQNRIVLFAMICALFNLANLAPIWKFDGGQVLRQLFRNQTTLAIGSAVVLAWFVVIGVIAGMSHIAMIAICGVVLLLSIMTAGNGIKPKKPLVAMSGRERFSLMAAFASVFLIHGSAIIWSAEKLTG